MGEAGAGDAREGDREGVAAEGEVRIGDLWKACVSEGEDIGLGFQELLLLNLL